MVRDGALAVPEDHVCDLGKIIDISRGGLSFQYLADGGVSKESFELDILEADNGFYLEKIPVKTVSDFEVANEVPFSFIAMRRRGVKFRELMVDQIAMLEYFMENYTIADS
jgi:hypothetical protein